MQHEEGPFYGGGGGGGSQYKTKSFIQLISVCDQIASLVPVIYSLTGKENQKIRKKGLKKEIKKEIINKIILKR